MLTALIIIACGLSFLAGASLKKTIKVTTPRRLKRIKKANRQLERINTITTNIDNYNGSSEGQIKVK